MELFFTTSFIAAFMAGVAALFAPCCIGVLLPSYLASIFRERKKVFLMTFFFFLGILLVFLPLGLGSAAVGKFFKAFHNQIFVAGGIFMVFLGLAIISGKHFSLPFSPRISIQNKNRNVFSIFTLGVFSGLATLCCAPVLAGLLSLSILPASFFWGGVYSLSYVLGMTAPLFFIALFLDRINFTQKFMILRTPIKYQFPVSGRQVALPAIEAVAGLVFLAMGALITFLALENKLFLHSDYQLTINLFIAKILSSIQGFVKFVPNYVIGLLAIIVFLIIILFATSEFRRSRNEGKDEDEVLIAKKLKEELK